MNEKANGSLNFHLKVCVIGDNGKTMRFKIPNLAKHHWELVAEKKKKMYIFIVFKG